MKTEAVGRSSCTPESSRLPVMVSAVILFLNEAVLYVLTQAGLQEGGVLAGDRWRASLLMSAAVTVLQYIHRDTFRWFFPLLQAFCWLLVPVAWLSVSFLHWQMTEFFSAYLLTGPLAGIFLTWLATVVTAVFEARPARR